MAGIVAGALLSAGVAYAAVGNANIRVSYDGIRIVVGGKVVPTSAQPFVYDKNVYVPVSAVAHALRGTVKWVNKPAAAVVVGPALPQPVSVYYLGRKLPDGITNGRSYLAVPAQAAAYAQATGLTAAYTSSGDVLFTPPAHALAAGQAYLTSLQPSSLSGDFTNTTDYPDGVVGTIAASVLGRLHAGAHTIEWTVQGGQLSVVPTASYALGGAWQTLTGALAIDDDTSDFGGQVRLLFTSNGNQVALTKWASAGAEPVAFSVDVAGLDTLTVAFQLRSPDGHVYQPGGSFTAPSASGTYLAVDVVDPVLTPAATSGVSGG